MFNWLPAFFVLICPIIARSQSNSDFIIQNLHVISTQSDTSDVEVTIWVEGGKLEMVSSEKIAGSSGIAVYDGKDGFILGELKLGSAPNFIIVNVDPRSNFDLWLNFNDHLLFAVDHGIIRINKLPKLVGEQEKVLEKPNKLFWNAYAGPPFALPLAYSSTRKWNYLDAKVFSVLFSAALGLDRMYWLSQNDASKRQIGDLKPNAGGEIRGLRFGAVGKINLFKRPWNYTIFIATNAFDKGFESKDINNFTLFDYRLDIPLNEDVLLSIGKQKEPVSLERVPSSLFNQMQERVSDAFFPARNFGIQASGNAFKQKVSWAGGVFNSWIDLPGSFAENETSLIGRITAVPFSFDRNMQVHFGLSNKYANGRNGVQYGIKPEFNKSIRFLSTDSIDTKYINVTATEVSVLIGSFWVFSEYSLNHINSTSLGINNFSSFHITGSWILSGENRTYRLGNGTVNPIVVANSVRENGWGAWELTSRISSYNLNDRTIQAGKMQIYSLGLNWWLTSAAAVSFNFRHIRTHAENELGLVNGINTRLLLILD